MPRAAVGQLLARLADAPDPDLLARFVASRDESAFAALVRRHGPMVLGVCRRLARDAHRAEDAFQAAFLVLARKANTIRPGHDLAGWLHGVARKAAFEAQRRAGRETLVPAVPDTPRPDPDRPDPDVLARLDREIARLPAAHRAAVVLCELEGRSRAEAARLLGIPEGTLSSRLASARKKLAAGLKRAGVLPAVGLTAGVPASLAAAAVRTATDSDSAPPRVAALAAGVSRIMYATQLKALAAAGAALVAIAALLMPERPANADPSPTAKPAAKAREPQILVWVKGKALLLKDDGTIVRKWEGEQVPEVGAARLSPDGTRTAVLRPYETRTTKAPVALPGKATLQGSFGRSLYRLTICPVADMLTGPDVDLPGESVESVVWSGDGTKLYAGTHDDDETFGRMKNLRYFVIDAKTLKATEMKLPEGHSLRDVSADGKLYLTAGPRPVTTVGRPLWLVPADGSEPVRLTDMTEGSNCAQFSPDAKTVLACGVGTLKVSADADLGPGRCPPAKSFYWFDTLSIADRTRSPVVELKPVKLVGDEAVPQPVPGAPGWKTVPNPNRDFVWLCRWSPDGKRVVYLPRTLPTDFDRLQAAVTVANRDGTGKKLILDFAHPGNISIDWR